MAWGAMGGIGAALTNLSANMAEMDKAKLRDKLEADREVARETREAAKLKRTTSYRKLTNGKWQSYNADDELLRETTATPEEIAKAQQDAELAALGIRKERAGATVAEVTAADAPAAVERKIAEHKSGLAKDTESIRASRDASARGWKGLALEAERNKISEKGLAAKLSGTSGDGKPTELSAVARQLRQDYDKMVTSLMEDTAVNLTESEAQELARNSAVAAVREGKDFGDVYRRALTNFADQRKAGRK